MEEELKNINEEKPYYSKQERIIYIKTIIEEAVKQNNIELANKYRMLLKVIENSDSNDMMNFMLKQDKSKKTKD